MNVSEQFPDSKQLAEVFSLLGQPARLNILLAIGNGQVCVCHLESALGLRQAYISQQLMLLRNAGLIEVQSEAFFPIGGPACSELERATVEQVHDALIAAGIATEAEIDLHLLNVASGRLDLATSPMVSAWGRKPTA